MLKSIISLLAITILCSCGVNKETNTSKNIIKSNLIMGGYDDRKDISKDESENDKNLFALSKSVVALVKSHNLKEENDRNLWVGKVMSLDKSLDYTKKDLIPDNKPNMKWKNSLKFTKQSALSFCTGFYIGNRLILTAGHCVQKNNNCDDFKIVFDYKVEKNHSNKITNYFPSKNVYHCKKVISRGNSSNDHAILELDRDVIGRAPVQLNLNSRLENNSTLFMIGHPTGLPMKFSGYTSKVDNGGVKMINAQLDSFRGNSGGPIFNSKTSKVEGILVQGPLKRDYFYDQRNGHVDATMIDENMQIYRIQRLKEQIEKYNIQYFSSIVKEFEKNIINAYHLNNTVKRFSNLNGFKLTNGNPLLLAMKSSNLELIRLMLERGFDPNYKSDYGILPLDYAKFYLPSAINLLEKYNAKSEVTYKSLKTLTLTDLTVQKDISIDIEIEDNVAVDNIDIYVEQRTFANYSEFKGKLIHPSGLEVDLPTSENTIKNYTKKDFKKFIGLPSKGTWKLSLKAPGEYEPSVTIGLLNLSINNKVSDKVNTYNYDKILPVKKIEHTNMQFTPENREYRFSIEDSLSDIIDAKMELDLVIEEGYNDIEISLTSPSGNEFKTFYTKKDEYKKIPHEIIKIGRSNDILRGLDLFNRLKGSKASGIWTLKIKDISPIQNKKKYGVYHSKSREKRDRGTFLNKFTLELYTAKNLIN